MKGKPGKSKSKIQKPTVQTAVKKPKKPENSMASLRDLLLGFMEGAFKEGTWQPSLWDSVKGLTAEQALWRTPASHHSIWDLVNHVILWKESAVTRVGAGKWSPDIPEYDTLDWKPAITGTEADWQATLKRLQATHDQLCAVVKSKTDAQLLADYKGKTRSFPIYHLLEGALTHDVYHAGQIRALAVAQGVK